jgi:hypothetical protein
LHFILVIEGISRLIKEAKEVGNFRGINIGGNCCVAHLLFIDDILILCEGSRRMVEKLKDMIELLCMFMGMKINLVKSMISIRGINEAIKNFIIQMFPYNLVDIDAKLKYPRFQIKRNMYKICD